MEKQPSSEKTDMCDATQAQLAAFVAKELDRDTERQIQAHVLECDACEQALSQLIETSMTPKLTEVFYRPMPSAPDPILEALGAQADPLPQDIDWSALQTLKTNPPPSVQATWEAVRQALLVLVFTHETDQSAIRGQWDTRSALQSRSGTRAAGQTAEAGIQVAVVNPAGEQQGYTVAFTLSEPPTLTPDNEFVATLRTDDPRVAGGSLRCTVRLNETLRLTFTGMVQPARDGTGWIARIRAENVPVLVPAAARNVSGASRSGSDALPPAAAPDVVISMKEVTWSVQERPKPAVAAPGRAVLIGIKHPADAASQAAESHGLQEAIGLYLLLTHPDYGALAPDHVLLLLDGTDVGVRKAADRAIQWLMQECGVSLQPGIIEEIVEKRLLPTQEEMVAAIRSAAYSATADETLLLYVAGQAQVTEGRGYLLSPQTRPPLYFWTALPLPQVSALLHGSQAQDTVFLLDTTYTGEGTDPALSQEQLQKTLFANIEDIACFATGLPGKRGVARDKSVGPSGLSPFTAALLEGLSGKADPESTGSVTLADLAQYVTERVSASLVQTSAEDKGQKLAPYLKAPQAERIVVRGKRPAVHRETDTAGQVAAESEKAGSLDVRVWVQSTATPFQDGAPGEAPQPKAVTPTFQINQAIRLGVATSLDAWVYLLDVNTAGQITQLLPSTDWPDHRLRGQRQYFFSKETDPYDLEAEGPPGVETFLAIATLEPLALLSVGEQAGEEISLHELTRVADALSRLRRDHWAVGQVQFVVRA